MTLMQPPTRPSLEGVVHSLSVPEEQMTWRARAYLTVGALRHLLIGSAIVAAEDQFDSDSFSVIISILPLAAWGVVFLVGGLHLAYAAVRAREGAARTALVMSAGMTAAWGMGFLLAFIQGGVVSPVGAILFSALAAKDLVVCAQPLRSPFEPIVRKYTRDSER